MKKKKSGLTEKEIEAIIKAEKEIKVFMNKLTEQYAKAIDKMVRKTAYDIMCEKYGFKQPLNDN